MSKEEWRQLFERLDYNDGASTRALNTSPYDVVTDGMLEKADWEAEFGWNSFKIFHAKGTESTLAPVCC